MAHLRLRDLQRDQSGSTAVEMAFIAPVFLALAVGIIQSGLLLFTKGSLHYAVQKQARCLAIGCSSPENYYFAPGPLPQFTPTNLPSCQAVTGTVTYDFNVILYQQVLSLSATACFPRIIDAAP